MRRLICTKFLDQFLIVDRQNGKGIKIGESLYLEVRDFVESGRKKWSERLKALFSKFEIKHDDSCLADPKNLLLIRELSEFSFGKASYELTNACNYRCGHCWLDDKNASTLSLKQKKRIVDIVERAGCLWLQLTGGEPLTDRHFLDVYRYAHEKGLLLEVLTNGSKLSQSAVIETFREYPPHRLTISVYGASRSSYEALTNRKGSFQSFLSGLEATSSIRTKIRLNIILTKFNKQENAEMQDLARRMKAESFVYSYLTPTLQGKSSPIALAAECMTEKRLVNHKEKEWRQRCLAGRRFFHIDSAGRASICKIARELTVDLVKDSLGKLLELSSFADSLLNNSAQCLACIWFDQCPVCPPKLRLYQKSGEVPVQFCPITRQ